MEYDETSLIMEAQRDPAEFAVLYDRYVQVIYRYIYSRVEDRTDAEDLTAQTFLGALEALPRYRHRGHFPAWLFSIARSKAMDHFRHRRKQVPLDESKQSDEPDPLVHLAHSDEIRDLSALVRTLAGEERELIRLRYVADMPFAEMAALLGKKEDAVKKSLYRLLARLQSQLEASHD